MDIDTEVGCGNQNVSAECHFSFTEDDIWAVIKELKPSRNANISIGRLNNCFAEKYGMENNADVQKILKYQLKQYKLLIAKRSLSKSVVLSFQTAQSHKQGTKRRKSFTSLASKSRRERTDSLLTEIEKLVDDENRIYDERNEEQLTNTQILGYLIYRINCNSDRQVSILGMSIFEGKYQKAKKFSSDEVVALLHDLTLTKQQMQTLKGYFSSKDITFPNANQLLDLRKTLRPEIHAVLDGNGVSVNYTELIVMTTQSLITVIEAECKIDDILELTVTYKDGGDTAGSETVWKSAEMIGASDHLFQYSVVPLTIQQGSKVLWKNASHISATGCRPAYLLRASEDDAQVIDLVFPATYEQCEELQKSSLHIVSKTNQCYVVNHVIHDTMKDLKLKKKLSGLGGGDCILCNTRKQDWKNEDKIIQGFPITRMEEETRRLFMDLMHEGDGEIRKTPKDYEHRQRSTSEPKTTSDQHSITVLHSYINVLGWFLKVLYRCESGYECWVEKQTVLGEPICRSKQGVQDMLRPVGLIVDQVAGANAKNGTSNDGNTARMFFLMKNRDIITDCVMEKYKEVIGQLQKKISILL